MPLDSKELPRNMVRSENKEKAEFVQQDLFEGLNNGSD